MKKKINRLFLLLIFSLSFIVFSSCNFQETENHTGVGYIRISFDEEEKSRTIKPRIDTSEITNIRLYGTKSGNLKMLLGGVGKFFIFVFHYFSCTRRLGNFN